MQASQIPTKFLIPFANNAAAGTSRQVPQASQVSTNPGAASLYDGFPTATGQPLASGGVPPAMQDFNGLFNQITAWSRWQNAGGTVSFDSTFSNAVGGYPAGAVLASTTPGTLWLNTADNNTTNPDSGSASGWIPIVTGTVTVPAPTSRAAFSLQSAQTIANNSTTQITVTGPAPAWASVSGNTITITSNGNYAVNLSASGTVTPSTQTSHATIFFIYINNANVAQQSCINWTSQAQTIGLSVQYTDFFAAGTTISFWAYMGNSGTTDTCVVNTAKAVITKTA